MNSSIIKNDSDYKLMKSGNENFYVNKFEVGQGIYYMKNDSMVEEFITGVIKASQYKDWYKSADIVDLESCGVENGIQFDKTQEFVTDTDTYFVFMNSKSA